MACSDSGMVSRQLEVTLAALERCSFDNRREGCRTVELGCKKCDRQFTEELEAAKGKVSNGTDLLCLACDPDALVPAISVLIVRIGWDR